jgi:RP/EB family microtubule-associated protein
MSESFGIMDEGYFVSRKEILRWVNHTLGLDLTAVEQLGSGAVYCQLMDALLPGMAPLHKINWRARQEYEFIQNFKLLQTIFDKMGISKKVEVSMITIQIQRLAKCKYQDNLEFIQWLKRYI